MRFPVAFCLNAIPYGLSYGAYTTDGFEVAGWPLYFWECGGFSGQTRFNRLYLLVDILVALAIAAAIGISLQDGARAFLERARALFRKAAHLAG